MDRQQHPEDLRLLLSRENGEERRAPGKERGGKPLLEEQRTYALAGAAGEGSAEEPGRLPAEPTTGAPAAEAPAGKRRGRPKETPAQKAAKEMLRKAAPEAVALLLSTMADGEAKRETRLDCAKLVLDRVFGKATAAPDGPGDTRIEIVMESLGEMAK